MNWKTFLIRLLTGVLFAAIIGGGILFHEYSFFIIVCTLLGLTQFEFYQLADKYQGTTVNNWANNLMGIYLFSVSFAVASDLISPIFYAAYLLYLLYMFIIELFRKNSNPILNWAFTILGHTYIVLPISLSNLLVFGLTPDANYMPMLPIAILLCVGANDSFAYILGSIFGKHRLYERISPKKSWEGFAGGIIGSILFSLINWMIFGTLTPLQWIGFGLICSTFATFGDLCESLLKRNMQVKDSGNILPGHGGMLDRLDATLMVIPAITVYLGILGLLIVQ